MSVCDKFAIKESTTALAYFKIELENEIKYYYYYTLLYFEASPQSMRTEYMEFILGKNTKRIYDINNR